MDDNILLNRICSFRDKQFDCLIREENAAGGYEGWYAGLEPFRQLIKE